MDATAIATVSAAVLALVQLLKWAKLVPDRWAPLAIFVVAAFGVALYVWSKGAFVRTLAFDYFAGWIAVATMAAGVYGFAKSATGAGVANPSRPNTD